MSITIAVQPCWAFQPHRNGSHKTINVLAGREGAERPLAGQQQEMASSKRGLILLPPATLVLQRPPPSALSGAKAEGSWQPSLAFSSLGWSGRHLSPLGSSQTALFIPQHPHLACCRLPSIRCLYHSFLFSPETALRQSWGRAQPLAPPLAELFHFPSTFP